MTARTIAKALRMLNPWAKDTLEIPHPDSGLIIRLVDTDGIIHELHDLASVHIFINQHSVTGQTVSPNKSSVVTGQVGEQSPACLEAGQ